MGVIFREERPATLYEGNARTQDGKHGTLHLPALLRAAATPKSFRTSRRQWHRRTPGSWFDAEPTASASMAQPIRMAFGGMARSLAFRLAASHHWRKACKGLTDLADLRSLCHGDIALHCTGSRGKPPHFAVELWLLRRPLPCRNRRDQADQAGGRGCLVAITCTVRP